MRRVAALVALLLSGLGLAGAQGRFDLESCRAKARERHPLSRQYALIDAGEAIDRAMARRGFLPRLSLSGKASGQSDVTSLPISMPGLSSMSKDHYLALAEFDQTIWDGGAIATRVLGIDVASRVDRRQLDVDLYALDARVDQLFFGLLSAREQLKQNELLIGELESNRRRVEACLANGVASPSDLDALRVELLKARQRSVELEIAEKTSREALALLLGEAIPRDSVFDMPEPATLEPLEGVNRRPELGLFDAQATQCDAQEDAVRVSKFPKLGAFLQVGYGRPGLNMLDDDLAPYWVGGVRLSWSANGLLDRNDELGKIDDKRRSIEARRDAFVLDSDIRVAGLKNDIAKLRELLAFDREIIELRAGMTRSTEGKYENGSATADDLLNAIDAEDLSRRAASLHELQLVQAIYALKFALDE